MVPVPRTADLHLVEQKVPGADVVGDGSESKGLPDACIYDDNGWAVLFESKVQAHISMRQIRRHVATAERHGYENPMLVILAVDRPPGKLPKNTTAVEWRNVYQWFGKRAKSSFWARALVEFMQVFESKMNAHDYGIRGTLTMFNGLTFDSNHPYTYREGKRLIRLLGDELQQRKDLQKVGVDPNGKRRPAITGRGLDGVWDFLPLKVPKKKVAKKAKPFTDYPHFTMVIRPHSAVAAVTVPNGVKGGLRTKLRETGLDGFRSLVSRLEHASRPIVRRSKSAKRLIYLTQRHYRSQSSPAEVDAHVNADLETIVRSSKSAVKHQPQWIDAIYELFTHKRSNMQLGVEVLFKYDCPIVRSPQAVDLFAYTWIALMPLVKFVLSED